MHISLPESFQWNVCSSWMKFVSSSACYLSCGLLTECWPVLTCADIWLHAPYTLRWCFSLSANVLCAQPKMNPRWNLANIPHCYSEWERGWGGWQMCRHVRQIYEFWHFFPEMPGQVEKLSCCARCWLMCVCVTSHSLPSSPTEYSSLAVLLIRLRHSHNVIGNQFFFYQHA